ncbi:MAG: hypothetical protein PHS59_03920 [Paludibacter sp.]|nr:hypothetical protein [Paludibacter sp.]
MKKSFLYTLLLFISITSYSRNKAPIETNVDRKIQIYLDCDDCNSSFFTRNLNYVDIVRDAKLADVHIFGTKQKTASNSIEYGMNFIGFNRYADLHYNLKTFSPQDETEMLKWERLLKIINIGLLPHLSRTPEISEINISHSVDTMVTQKK